MTKNAARVLLVVACVGAAAAAVQSVRIDHARRDTQARISTLQTETGALITSLSDLRAAQMAYLATGQGPDFWMRRVTELSGYIDTGLARLREASRTPGASTQLDRARAALTELMQFDERARGAIQADQRFLASDIVFADSVSTAQAFVEAVGSARAEERAAADAATMRDSYLQLAMLPLAVIVVLIAAYVAGSKERPAARSKAEEVAQMLRELPPPVKNGAPLVAAAAASPRLAAPAAPTPVPPPVVAVPEPTPARAIDWDDTAELCVDLARVLDTRDLPSLLARAAKAIDATGVVVWVVDVERQSLVPTLAHGYSDRVLARLGALSVEGDNVTSLSYRSMRPQSMPGAGKDGSASAIAVPLLTTDGCNGVLAAEIPTARPAAECVAVARIVAAQLSAMIAPVELPATASPGQAAEA